MNITDTDKDGAAPQKIHTGASNGSAPPLPSTGRSILSEAVYRLKNPSAGNRSVTQGNDIASSNRRTSGERRPSFTPNLTSKDLQTESCDDMILRLSNEFQPLVEADWDTVIYIGPPPQEHRQDDHEYEYIKQHFSQPYLMNSQTLKELSSAQINKFLGPMSARSERKLKKLGVHNLLPQDRKPRYYIDLRPMQDEDEALLMITELTCTPGVLSWHASPLASGVPKTSICGKDNLNITSKPYARSWIRTDDVPVEKDEESDLAEGSEGSEDASEGRPISIDLEPDYSTIRHYMAIERVLHALAGGNPKLNSAPKLWTFFAIAKFLDCATSSKITVWILDWLFTNNNTNFIQANPEVAYRIAMGIRSPDILRATFSMLVGERALMHAGRTSSGSMNMKPGVNQISAHGRAVCHLDDDEINRIDHAAFSLARRMNLLFDSIANGPLKTNSEFSELAKFQYLRLRCHDQDFINTAYSLLHDYVRGEVYAALSQNVQEGDLMRLYRTMGLKEFGWLKRSKKFADAYNRMPLPQRLLTQSFWAQLENYGLYQESQKTAAWSWSHSLDGLSKLAPDFDGEIGCVHKIDLCNTIEDMNRLIAKDAEQMLTYTKEWLVRLPHQGREAVTQHPLDPYGRLPQPDQELVRAMQGLGMNDEINIPGFDPRPASETGFDAAYPYSAVAEHHQRKGPILAIKPAALLAQYTLEMRSKIMKEVLTPGYVGDELGLESDISISQMDILLCLNDDEWKYLPLWAEGLDDGSGGVFAELDVPDMEAVEGFRGGAIGLGQGAGHEGSVGGSFSMAGESEDYDEVMTDEGVSTVGKASRIATDGTTSAGASTVVSLDE